MILSLDRCELKAGKYDAATAIRCGKQDSGSPDLLANPVIQMAEAGVDAGE
jgi:hypothetical protein